jgi:hypothetical protein
VRGQVSHPHNARSKIRDLYIFTNHCWNLSSLISLIVEDDYDDYDDDDGGGSGACFNHCVYRQDTGEQ